MAPLIAATALVSIPALAQDAAPQTAQPVVTPPSAPTIAIPPVVRTVPDNAPTATAAPAEEAAPRATTRATRTTATRSTAIRTAGRAAPARPAATAPAAPVPVAAPAKTTATTTTTTAAANPTAPAAPVAQAPETQPAAPATTQTDTTTTTSGVPTWAWIAGGIALLAIVLGAIAALRRRRVDEYDDAEPAYVDEQYVEPKPVIEPVAAAPIAEPVAASPRKEPEYLRRETPSVVGEVEPAVAAAEDVEVSSAPAEEVAELTATAPVAERPWLEFAMRPVRAGTNIDEALVEIELTVGNAGSVPARDVRISTFLLSGDAAESEMERLLVDAPADATTDPVTIQPGEGKRIDATLALLKADMGENLPEAFRPIVVADARYTLEDGTEGRTSASFAVGVTPEEGGALEPIELSRAAMHENVGAELHGEPQHA